MSYARATRFALLSLCPRPHQAGDHQNELQRGERRRSSTGFGRAHPYFGEYAEHVHRTQQSRRSQVDHVLATYGLRANARAVCPILDYHIPNPTPSHNQACALRVESELRVCLHGLGCWARARALARTFSSTSSSTTFDEAKGGGHRVGRSPPHARNTHTPTPACTVYPHARACLNHPPRRCTPFLPAHAPNPIPHLHSPKP